MPKAAGNHGRGRKSIWQQRTHKESRVIKMITPSEKEIFLLENGGRDSAPTLGNQPESFCNRL